jgi:hypothetical protein
MKQDQPNYRICIIKVDCDFATTLQRCEQRAKITQRIIPLHRIQTVYEKVPHSFATLRTLADCIVEIDNHTTPTITKILLTPNPKLPNTLHIPPILLHLIQ